MAYKTKKRIKELGEVFTPEKTVNEMLDLLPVEIWEINKTFLEPTCGQGIFLVEVLKRKIEIYKHDPLIAISTLYGVDIMEDNVRETKINLLKCMDRFVKDKNLKKAFDIINNNIVCADVMNYDFKFERKEE